MGQDTTFAYTLLTNNYTLNLNRKKKQLFWSKWIFTNKSFYTTYRNIWNDRAPTVPQSRFLFTFQNYSNYTRLNCHEMKSHEITKKTSTNKTQRHSSTMNCKISAITAVKMCSNQLPLALISYIILFSIQWSGELSPIRTISAWYLYSATCYFTGRSNNSHLVVMHRLTFSNNELFLVA